jgi:hypothetical protein
MGRGLRRWPRVEIHDGMDTAAGQEPRGLPRWLEERERMPQRRKPSPCRMPCTQCAEEARRWTEG